MGTKIAQACICAAFTAITALMSGPVSNAAPDPPQCYPTPTPAGVRCLDPRASADIDCQIIPPGPNCVVSGVPAKTPDGYWDLLIPAGQSPPAVPGAQTLPSAVPTSPATGSSDGR